MSVAAAILVAGGGVGALRYGWAQPAAARAATMLGWLAIAAATLWLGASDGAWGVAVAAMAVTLFAMLPLAHAALTDRRRERRSTRTGDSPVRISDSGVRLHTGGLRGIARRIAIFLIVVPGAGAVSLLAALAGQAVARAAGWHDANSITLGLLLLPAIWGVIAIWLMMRDGPAAMAARLALVAVIATPLFLLLR